MDSNLALVAERPARFGWTLADETTDADPPWLTVRLVPSFPECHPAINEAGIVFHLLDLFHSARRPGGYFLLNCTCGYPPDAGIEERVLVSHPDADTIIWELDVHGLGPTLEDYWTWHQGFLRLIFQRKEYEADLRAMLRDVRSAGSTALPVEALDPGGWDAYEQAMALRDEELCLREPLLPAGTMLEFGLFGPNLLVIDGKPDLGWPVRLLTRWSALTAFKRWIGYVSRGYAIRYKLGEEANVDLSWFTEPERRNDFFLLRESDRTACNVAGEAWVQTLRACFAEAETAPGVTIRYQVCRSPAVLSEVTVSKTLS